MNDIIKTKAIPSGACSSGCDWSLGAWSPCSATACLALGSRVREVGGWGATAGGYNSNKKKKKNDDDDDGDDGT